MSDVLIEAKLRSPSLRSAMVPRPRLVERLAASDTPISVVVAPPGFGKTTVLLQWQSSNKGPCAWLSLDDGDNDPLVFWSCLVASIARVVPGFASSVLPALSSMGGLALDAVVARILNELEALDQHRSVCTRSTAKGSLDSVWSMKAMAVFWSQRGRRGAPGAGCSRRSR
jgi:LuxR family maltose regulon positive regulatory protein